MKEVSVEIVNAAGLHARPASALVKMASGFHSEVRVEKDGLEVNGKSIMGVLMLAAERGSTLTIRAEGKDADDVLAALADLVRAGFEEGGG